ncbi:hypothetical protein KKE38_01475 [Candidatus Micrarchaeota archaeon]|nr:hypothetical protein [Candidatus Micrarchaeota archaeon]MBU1681469.1 hypothetical protein [Candidatus Micrarchaeota archaeon]
MNPKWIYAIFGIVLLSGMAFAISGATVGTEVERGKWAGNTSGSVTTEGGNVSGVNVSAGVSTEKWASFYGDVVGSIVLADTSANQVYSWTWATTDGGEVCVTTDSAFDWASTQAAAGADIDTAFGFTAADADSGTSTTTSACTVDLDDVAAAVTTVGVVLDSTFQTCYVSDIASPAVENDLAFCVDINGAGTNYNSEAADYEVMVPTGNGPTDTETYYFFVELN